MALGLGLGRSSIFAIVMRPSLNGVGIELMEEDVFVSMRNDIKRQSFVTAGGSVGFR